MQSLRHVGYTELQMFLFRMETRVKVNWGIVQYVMNTIYTDFKIDISSCRPIFVRISQFVHIERMFAPFRQILYCCIVRTGFRNFKIYGKFARRFLCYLYLYKIYICKKLKNKWSCLSDMIFWWFFLCYWYFGEFVILFDIKCPSWCFRNNYFICIRRKFFFLILVTKLERRVSNNTYVLLFSISQLSFYLRKLIWEKKKGKSRLMQETIYRVISNETKSDSRHFRGAYFLKIEEIGANWYIFQNFRVKPFSRGNY